ncbi:hypothetical protein EV421DRAFT_1936727 [Armillaria borealis]|uniref:Uncharacterized protein n=1 Tax=Armillaria borealis TaxID=47425 RepID=A0AA39IV10_9AGAR|nr:hypothetical protein EV421DRAFT_1936727 [Armillaria borealis]
MQITPDFHQKTLIAISATAVGLTTVTAALLLYRSYRQEIRQYICHLFLVAPRQPIPRPPTVPLHYVQRMHRGPIGPPLSSQSSGLPSPSYPSDSSRIHTEQEELDIGEEGRRILDADHQSLSVLTGSIERLEESEELHVLEALESTRSSPEFPTRHSTPRPVIIITDSETTTGYAPQSPTASEYTLWLEDNHLAPHAGNRLPCSTPRSPWSPDPSSPIWETDESIRPDSQTLELAADVRRATAAVEEAAIREYLAQAELERITTRDKIIAAYYLRSSCPRMSSSKSDTRSPSVSSQGGSRSIGSTEHASSLGDTLESLSIRGWPSDKGKGRAEMTPEEQAYEYTSIWNTRCTDLTTEVSWRLLEAGQAWEQADPVEQEDIISHSTTEQAIKIFNEFYPRYALPSVAPYQSRYHRPPLPKSPPTMLTSRPLPFSLPRSHPYKGAGRVRAGGDHNLWEAPADPDDDDSDIEVKQAGNQGTSGNQGNPGNQAKPYADQNARNPDRWSLPGAPPKFDPDDVPPNPVGSMGDDAPWIGCKPDLVRKPLPFKGEPDDIDRFITDCQMYFQVHSAYMWLDPYRVAFASSYFEDKAKGWWTLQLAELYSATQGKYRFPPWAEFVTAVDKKFKDPAHEERQKAKMYTLCMIPTHERQ